MFKKILVPLEELQYRIDGIDNKYLINEGDRSVGLFALNKDQMLPAQISPQNLCIYVLEGNVEIDMDDKTFNMKQGEMLLVPKTSSYNFKTIENTKLLAIRI